MGAAVSFARGNGDAPPLLSLGLMAGGQPLKSGGFLEQSYRMERKIGYLLGVYRAIRKMSSLEGDEINTMLSTSERLLLGDLRTMGYL